MGIGLAICSEILKVHDFEYGVASETDTFTEFFFIIPNQYTKYGINLI